MRIECHNNYFNSMLSGIRVSKALFVFTAMAPPTSTGLKYPLTILQNPVDVGGDFTIEF